MKSRRQTAFSRACTALSVGRRRDQSRSARSARVFPPLPFKARSSSILPLRRAPPPRRCRRPPARAHVLLFCSFSASQEEWILRAVQSEKSSRTSDSAMATIHVTLPEPLLASVKNRQAAYKFITRTASAVASSIVKVVPSSQHIEVVLNDLEGLCRIR
eukprot:5655956-Pyramimonas_sp.AAC.1